jgi:hypothetical protein
VSRDSISCISSAVGIGGLDLRPQARRENREAHPGYQPGFFKQPPSRAMEERVAFGLPFSVYLAR